MTESTNTTTASQDQANSQNEQFADVKNGDRVWSINHGQGQVTAIGEHVGFRVEFDSYITEQAYKWYDRKGRAVHNPDVAQTLFWDEVTITPPPKPRREVTHTIERWVNVYTHGTSTGCFTSKDEADEVARYVRAECVRLTGTYTTLE